MNNNENQEGMVIVFDKKAQDFFICSLVQAKKIESDDMIIQISAEPKTPEELEKENLIISKKNWENRLEFAINNGDSFIFLTKL